MKQRFALSKARYLPSNKRKGTVYMSTDSAFVLIVCINEGGYLVLNCPTNCCS